ncbi:uncharacterized protein [Argopecten irradians]|uniref:uncharacterized protein n=1 Tax=Argopecten irradians TaxID=31199 RepID=UPI00371E08A4
MFYHEFIVTCTDTGNITVSGDDTIESVLWECDDKSNDTKVLNVSSGIDNVFVLSGCPLNEPVRVILYNTSINLTTHVAVKSHLINERILVCDGANITVTGNINGHLAFPTAATQIPISAKLGMEVLNSDNSTLTTDVDIENTYKLKITGPVNMYILVESCVAAANADFTNAVSLYSSR